MLDLARQGRMLEALEIRYKLLKVIAEGGTSTINLALDRQSGEQVVVKRILKELQNEYLAAASFKRELALLSKLDHPGISRLIGFDQSRRPTYLVMEYVPGRSLRKVIRGERLYPQTAVSYAIQIADALSYIHSQGIVHKDLKPENIIINLDERPVLVDFGISTQPNSPEQALLPKITGMQQVPDGTTEYISPEQALGLQVDARSDIFSLGIVLYEMLTGSSPFQKTRYDETLYAIKYQDYSRLETVCPDLKPDLGQIIDKALKKNPADRYQSVDDLKQDLQRLAETGTYQRTPLEIIIAKQRLTLARVATSAKHSLTRWPALAAIACLFFLTIVVAVRFINRNSGRIPTAGDFREIYNWKTTASDLISSARVSRNGKFLVYCTGQQNKQNLYLKSLSDGQTDSLAISSRARNLVLSPDGQTIAYVSDEHEPQLFTIQAQGAPQTIGPIAPDARLVAWSRDGQTLFFENDGNLFSFRLADKSSRQLTQFTKVERAHDFSVNQDETKIAFVASDGQTDIWSSSLTGENRRRLTNDEELERTPVWRMNQDQLFFGCRRETWQICTLSPTGQAEQISSGDDRDYYIVDVSGDGATLFAYGIQDQTSNWQANSDGTSLMLNTKLGCEIWPRPSPDGKFVAFHSATTRGRIPYSKIVLSSVQAMAEPKQITTGFDVQWSPSGEQMAFLRATDEGLTLWMANRDGSDVRQMSDQSIQFDGYTVLPANPLQQHDFSWSPDGTRIAYATRSTDNNIWITTVNGSKEQVTDNSDNVTSMHTPYWGPLNQLAYVMIKTDGNKRTSRLMIFGLDNKQSKELFSKIGTLRILGRSPNGTVIYLAASDRSVTTGLSEPHDVDLLGIDVTNGNVRMTDRISSGYFSSVDLSRDARQIAYVAKGSGPGECDNLWIKDIGDKAIPATQNIDPGVFISGVSQLDKSAPIFFTMESRWTTIYQINLK